MKEVLSTPDCSVHMILGRICGVYSELADSVSNVAAGDYTWLHH
jgi:hypothetical protein